MVEDSFSGFMLGSTQGIFRQKVTEQSVHFCSWEPGHTWLLSLGDDSANIWLST